MLQEKKTIFHAKSVLRELSGDPGLYDEVSASQIFFPEAGKGFFISRQSIERQVFARATGEAAT